jgi:hypothetical protein
MPLWFEIAVVVFLFAIVVALGGIEVNLSRCASRLEAAIRDRESHGNSRANL